MAVRWRDQAMVLAGRFATFCGTLWTLLLCGAVSGLAAGLAVAVAFSGATDDVGGFAPALANTSEFGPQDYSGHYVPSAVIVPLEDDGIIVPSTAKTDEQSVVNSTSPVSHAGNPCGPGWSQAVLTAEMLEAPKHHRIRGWGLGRTARFRKSGVGPAHLDVTFPKGSINPGNKNAPRGGVGLRWRPPELRGAEHVCLTYRLRLPADFPFVKGGKLPGLMGGSVPTGGRTADGRNGFSLRLMWRRGGNGEVYAYVPGHPAGRGLSIDRGAWIFPRGRWITIRQELRLNAPHEADGHLRLWIDGRLVIERNDFVVRHVRDMTIDGVALDSFFGGSDPSYATPRATSLQIADVVVAVPGWAQKGDATSQPLANPLKAVSQNDRQA